MGGTIVQISLRNFLSHENFELKLDKNINFIVGKNGSGKSAVLAAMVVGLGGRASSTDRGQNLQSFIKHGANSARIEIKIKNGPDKSYKTESYGEFITISRTINLSGGSSYKIKNSRGDVVSTKLDELVKICGAFNIQVDNPICVLNQTEAQNFHASDRKLKYKLFKKATNLDIIKSNHETALQNCLDSRKILLMKREAFGVQEKELTNLKEKYQDVQTYEEIQKSIKKLENEYYWCIAEDYEKQYKTMSETCDKQKRKIENFVSKIQNYEELRNKHKASIESIEKQFAEIAESTRNKNNVFKTINSEYQDLKIQWKSCHQQLSKKKEQIYKEGMKVKDLEKEVKSAMNINFEDEKEALENKKKLFQDQLAELIARQNTTKNDLLQTRNAMLQSQSSYDKIVLDRQNLEYSKKNISSQLRELSVRGKNNLAIFGSKMVDLVNAINSNKNKFSQMPRGPIGSYLKVHDKKWSGAIEYIMGQTLMSFCVANNQDSRVLFSLMEKIYGRDSKPSIITTPFYEKVHNVSRHAVKAPPGYFSALNALKIDDPVVANVLIDSLGLESILLVSQHDEAIHFAANVNNVPHNCKKIITLDSSEFFPMPNYRSYGGRGLASKFIQVSSSERKIQLENEFKAKEGELNKLDSEIKKLNESKTQFRTKEMELDRYSRKFLSQIQNIEGNLLEIENNIKNLEFGHMRVLNEELKSTVANMSVLQKEETELKNSEVSMRNKLKETEVSLNQLKANKCTQEDKQISLKEELSQYQLQHERNESDKVKANEFLDIEKKKLSQLNEKLEELEKVVQETVNNALDLCPRIVSPGDKKTIEEKLRKKELKLLSLNTSGMTKESILQELVTKEKQNLETYNSLDQMLALIEKAKRVAQQHIQHGVQIQNMIGARLQYFFVHTLSVRGYSGNMTLDHGSGALDIFCTGKDSMNIDRANNTVSLSGGERTYATVSFLLSLWDCMDLPFYFLDEFDLFMDVMNRRVTMNLLVNHATKNVDKQYVFLSPLDTAYLVENNNVMKIHRLQDPKRSQPVSSTSQ